MPAASTDRSVLLTRGRLVPAAPRDPAKAELSSAYAMVRKARGDPGLRLALAEAMMQTDRRDLARRHATKAVALASPDWHGAAALADLHFRLGDFDTAYTLLRAGEKQGKNDAEALRNMAAILLARGEKTGSRECLARAARLDPIIRPASHDPAKPTILRLRSVERSHYRIKYDKSERIYKRFLRGGHFSLKNLIDHSQLNIYLVEIFGDNLGCVGDLPRFEVVINSISCADRSPAALREAMRFLAHYPDVPVINHPHAVLETRRERNFQRLGSLDGVLFPRTELFRNDSGPGVIAGRLEERGFAYPLIMRLAEKHTGVSLRKLDDRAALLDYLGAAPRDANLYAIQFVDCRGRDGLYHKTRVFFVDGVLYPVANLAADTWQIHSADRYRVMADREDPRAEEVRFLTGPERFLGSAVVDALYAISRVIGLDFFGIDFTVDRAGRLVVFEANAAMRHNFDHAGRFPYTRPHLERVTQAFGEMLRARLASAATRGAGGGQTTRVGV